MGQQFRRLRPGKLFHPRRALCCARAGAVSFRKAGKAGIGAVIPCDKTFRCDVGAETAVQHRRLALGTPRTPQIDTARRAVGDEIAVPEHEAQPVGFARRGGDIAVGDVIVHGAEGAVLEQRVSAAEDEIDVPRDLAFGIVLGRRAAGRKALGPRKPSFSRSFSGSGAQKSVS